MAGGYLNFEIPKPGWLDFGRSAAPANELTIQITLAPVVPTFSFFAGLRLKQVVAIRHSTAIPLQQIPALRQQAAQPLSAGVGLQSQAGQPRTAALALKTQAGQPMGTGVGLRQQTGQPVGAGVGLKNQTGQPISAGVGLRQQTGQPVGLGIGLLSQSGQPVGLGVGLRQQAGHPLRMVALLQGGTGVIVQALLRVVWQQARLPPHGWRVPLLPNPLAGKKWGQLNFVCPKGGYLNFGQACFGARPLLVPVHRSYRVLNTFSLIRVSDGANIPVTRLLVALYRTAWCWTLQASLSTAAARALIPAYPGTVRATINGFAWDFVVDEAPWSRGFGRGSATLNGRSPAAAYAEPYASPKSYRESQTKTAEQLALQELGYGWSLDWQLPMWTVPAGVWQYENLTPIEALIRLAKAAGGWLYADKQVNVLHVVPKWPQKPWDWSFVPDASLPRSYTYHDTHQSTVNAAYESILVSGGKDGIAAVCTRTGTGGATVAPNTIIDTLVTHLDAATPRAIQELADLWPMKPGTITLPLQAQPEGAGLLLPGTTFDFVDNEDEFRGLVEGVEIEAVFGKTTQTLEVVSL